jgi:hypothetical protein
MSGGGDWEERYGAAACDDLARSVLFLLVAASRHTPHPAAFSPVSGSRGREAASAPPSLLSDGR